VIASVVIPAHDEGGRIGEVLAQLAASAKARTVEVVVVANGCTDDTAHIARTFAGVRVAEIATASKTAALNEGDRVASVFPRIYLDGDVVLSAASVGALASALMVERPRAAGPRASYDLSGSSTLVRWFYDFRRELPVLQEGIIGAGCYAMNRAGRARFDQWPAIIGDDQFILRTFAPRERELVAEAVTHVKAPPDVASVIRRGVRVRRGNLQLESGPVSGGLGARPPAGLATALRRVAPTPKRWPSALTWLAVSVLIRTLTRTGSSGDWLGGR
jgi:glycosyltransferase involved in cell wall biosynthesis